MFAEFEKAYLVPIDQALQEAKLTIEQLDRIVLMGSGTRVPRLQEILGQYFNGSVLLA